MTLRNPNRFVTGLSDISYVKSVVRVDTSFDQNGVIVTPKKNEEIVRDFTHPKSQDTFVKDPFVSEPNNG